MLFNILLSRSESDEGKLDSCGNSEAISNEEGSGSKSSHAEEDSLRLGEDASFHFNPFKEDRIHFKK